MPHRQCKQSMTATCSSFSINYVFPRHFVIFLLCASRLPSFAIAANPAFNCSTTLTLTRGLSFDYTDCKHIEHAGGSTLLWSFDRPTRTFDAAYSASWEGGWLGWGIGVRMIGASALVAYSHAGGSHIVQYLLKSYTPTDNLPNTGNLNIINGSLKVYIEGGVTHMLFSLVLQKEQLDGIYIIMAKGTSPVDPATGIVQQHELSLATKMYLRLDGRPSSPPGWLQGVHAFVNILAWGVLLPLGMIVSRYFKEHEPAWFIVHRNIQVSGYLLGTIGFLIGLNMGSSDHWERDGGADPHGLHRFLGMSVMVLATLQVTALVLRPHKEAILWPWWSAGHAWNGRLILVLASLNIWEGMKIMQPQSVGWSYFYGIPVTLLVVVAVLLELRMCLRWLRDDTPTTEFQRWTQSWFPAKSSRRYSNLQIQREEAPVIDDRELEYMASQFKKELEETWPRSP